MTHATASAPKSPLHEMTQSRPLVCGTIQLSSGNCLIRFEHGAVGATCNPVIVLGVLKTRLTTGRDGSVAYRESSGRDGG